MNYYFQQKYSDIIKLFELGNYQEGLNVLTELANQSLSISESIAIARIYIELGLTDEANNIIDNLEDDSFELDRVKAEIAYKEGNLEKSLEFMNSIDEELFTHEDFFFISQLYFEEGLPEVAIRYINKAIFENEAISLYHYQKGVYSYEIGEVEEAVSSFYDAIELDRDEPLYSLALGEAYFSYGNFEKAIEQFDAVLNAFPDQEEALYLKGSTLILMGEINEGISYLENIAKLQPENLNVLVLLSDAYERINDVNKAYELLLRAIDINEFYVPALKRLGTIYYYAGQIENAKRIIGKALELEPEDYTLQALYDQITN